MTSDVVEQLVCDPKLRTPAFVCLEGRLLENCKSLRRIADAVHARPLYALKALTLPPLLPSMAEVLDGFSASSLFEARLAREFGDTRTTVHFTAPAIRPNELEPLSELCDFISLNSLGQLRRYGEALERRVELGLRINPELSFVGDPRYDPCASPSRLGATLDSIQAVLENDRRTISRIRGLHFHTNCESKNFDQLRETVSRTTPVLERLMPSIAWINLGGGYYFPEDSVPRGLQAAVNLLRAVNPGLQVYLEPGTAIAQDAGMVVTTVLDIIERSPASLVVLDTTINHMPEVFEYQFAPEVYGANKHGAHAYRLTGCSCLAGDVFGDYRFDRPVTVGSRLCFLDVGSYSLVKANMFNGVPTPLTYLVRADGRHDTICPPTYETWAGLRDRRAASR